MDVFDQKNPSLFRYIWQHSKAQQLIILALTIASFPLLYLTLELPKTIINEALADLSVPREFFGFGLEPIPYLVVLCIAFLALVLSNGWMKMIINTRVGQVGESMVRRLRYTLIQRMLRFPMPHFARLSQGEVISGVTAETEPLAGFIGDSLSLPVFQGGTMLTILAFMFIQDPILGVASIALIPVQAWLIPRMQKEINKLGKERVKLVRRLSERVGEGVSGAREVRLQGTQRRLLSEYSHWLGAIYRVRLLIFQKKFFMKFVNNLLGQLTPFLFFLVGGILVLQGDLTLGALVAALSAYKDLSSPWKELLNYYQRQADARIKFEQVVEQFAPEGMEAEIADTGDVPKHLPGRISLQGLSASNSLGDKVFSNVNLEIEPGERILIQTDNPVRRDRLGQVLARLARPDTGRVQIDGRDLASIPSDTMGMTLAYQNAEPILFAGTVYDNAVHPLRRRPPSEEIDRQALTAGNSADRFEGEWLDPSLIGMKSVQEVHDYWMSVLEAAGSAEIVYRSGLRDRMDLDRDVKLAQGLISGRPIMRRELENSGQAHLVHRLDRETFNPAFSLTQNLLFGTACNDLLGGRRISRDDYMGHVMTKSGLRDHMITMSIRLALKVQSILETGGGLEAFDYLDEQAVEHLQQLTPILTQRDLQKLTPDDRRFLGWLMMSQVPARHRLGLVDKEMTQAIVRARKVFWDDLPPDYKDAVLPFHEEEVHPELSVLENLVFGRLADDTPGAEQKLREIVDPTVDALGLRQDIMLLLAESQVGVGGSRMSAVARHNISLSRNLMKRPNIMVVQDGLGPLGRDRQTNVLNDLKDILPEMSIIWIDQDGEGLPDFDRVFELGKDGLTEIHGPASLMRRDDEEEFAAPDDADAHMQQEWRALSKVPVFQGIGDGNLTLLAATAKRLEVQVGDVLYDYGDEPDAAYVPLTARLDLWRQFDGQERPVLTVRPMEIIGDIEVTAETHRIGRLQVETAGEVLQVQGAMILDLLERDPKVARQMLKGIGRRFARPRDTGPAAA